MREYDEKEIRYTFTRDALEAYWKRKPTDEEWEDFASKALDQMDFAVDDLADNE